MSNIKIAQVAGGAGGGGALVDTVTSVSIQDTRIRMYSYAVTAACEIRLDDSTGSVGTNTQDSVYLPDQGIKISGVVSVVGISNGGKFFVYYG